MLCGCTTLHNLIGRKIGIGQVEIGRPGQFGLDKAVSGNRVMIRLAECSYAILPPKQIPALTPMHKRRWLDDQF